MYNPHQVITHLDANKWPIIGLCTVAMLFNYSWFFMAFRVARRDRAYSLPAFCTLFWLVGDSSFLWHFDKWFYTYKDWYVELFWVALLFTVMFEVAFTIQFIQYGRAELLPSFSQRQFAAVVLAGVGAAIVLWSLVRHTISDGLWITYFDFANVVGPVFAIPLLMRRRSRAGTTPAIWACYAAMAFCWYLAESLWFGPVFRSTEYVAVGVLCVAASLVMTYAVSRMPAYRPAGVEAVSTDPVPLPREVLAGR